MAGDTIGTTGGDWKRQLVPFITEHGPPNFGPDLYDKLQAVANGQIPRVCLEGQAGMLAIVETAGAKGRSASV